MSQYILFYLLVAAVSLGVALMLIVAVLASIRVDPGELCSVHCSFASPGMMQTI